MGGKSAEVAFSAAKAREVSKKHFTTGVSKSVQKGIPRHVQKAVQKGVQKRIPERVALMKTKLKSAANGMVLWRRRFTNFDSCRLVCIGVSIRL